jgi:hypothetical protein
MSALLVGALVSFILLGAVLIGTALRRLLPESHLTAESKDAVKLAMSLVATMTALILGLLVSSAKSTYETARSEVMQMAAKVADVDRMLGLYGPEAAGPRAQLHDAVADAVHRMWPDEARTPARLAPDTKVGDALFVAIHDLAPRDDAQRDIKAQTSATMHQIAELRTLLLVQSSPSISTPFLVAVVGWLVIIFLCFSLVAPANGTAIFAIVAAAVSVAGAVFLIMELDQPFAGFIRIGSEPMVNALRQLAK